MDQYAMDGKIREYVCRWLKEGTIWRNQITPMQRNMLKIWYDGMGGRFSTWHKIWISGCISWLPRGFHRSSRTLFSMVLERMASLQDRHWNQASDTCLKAVIYLRALPDGYRAKTIILLQCSDWFCWVKVSGCRDWGLRFENGGVNH